MMIDGKIRLRRRPAGRKTRRVSWFTWRIWRDQTARLLLGAAVAINLGLFAFLCARFPKLDLQLPLHFNIQGFADRIGTKTELFALPIIGLIILRAFFQWQNSAVDMVFVVTGIPFAFYWIRRKEKTARMDKKNS